MLFLNADTDDMLDITVNVSSAIGPLAIGTSDSPIGRAPSSFDVRDLWAGTDLGRHDGQTYTVRSIAPQDSRMLIFTPVH